MNNHNYEKTNQQTLLSIFLALAFGIQSCNTTQKENYQDAIEQIYQKFKVAYETKDDEAIKNL